MFFSNRLVVEFSSKSKKKKKRLYPIYVCRAIYPPSFYTHVLNVSSSDLIIVTSLKNQTVRETQQPKPKIP